MRLLVTGASGQIGWELSRSLMLLGEVIAVGRCACDLSRPAQLQAVIQSVRPDVIVNAAAYTAVDRAEEEETLATSVNGIAVGVMAEEARRLGVLLIHYSSDYVFDGLKNSPYTEDDAPHPINAYGRSKLAGEIAIRQAAGDYIVLRTSWVFAAQGRNFLRTILNLADKQKELTVVDDQVGAPTWARNIADASMLIIEKSYRKRLDGQFTSGFFNLTSSGTTSWHGFAEAILEDAERRPLHRFREKPLVRGIASVRRDNTAARPKNSRLSGDRLNQQFGIVLPDWRRSMSRCLDEITSKSSSL